jgi:hypothetical protein
MRVQSIVRFAGRARSVVRMVIVVAVVVIVRVLDLCAVEMVIIVVMPRGVGRPLGGHHGLIVVFRPERGKADHRQECGNTDEDDRRKCPWSFECGFCRAAHNSTM